MSFFKFSDTSPFTIKCFQKILKLLLNTTLCNVLYFSCLKNVLYGCILYNFIYNRRLINERDCDIVLYLKRYSLGKYFYDIHLHRLFYVDFQKIIKKCLNSIEQ